MAGHPVVHIEISAIDPQAASKFYSEVFGWKIEIDPNFNYYQFLPGSGPNGAFVQTGTDISAVEAGQQLIYFGADDIPGTLARIEANGGKVLASETEIPGIGSFAIFTDPTGNKIGLFKGNPQ